MQYNIEDVTTMSLGMTLPNHQGALMYVLNHQRFSANDSSSIGAHVESELPQLAMYGASGARKSTGLD